MRSAAIILAAGRGTRMRSKRSKLLHEVAGRPIIEHVVRAALALEASPVVVVLGHQREEIQAHLEETFPGAPLRFGFQSEQLGTAHAVRCGLDAIGGYEGQLLILCGDTPNLDPELLREFELHCEHARLGVMGMRLEDPGSYGRLLRDEAGHLVAIREARDCSPEDRAIREVNAGLYYVHKGFLFDTLQKLGRDNAQGEYYLTDIVSIAASEGHSVVDMVVEGFPSRSFEGVNDRGDLARAEARFQLRLKAKAMREGVTLVDPNRTYLQSSIQFGEDIHIEPDVSLIGDCVVGDDVIIEQGCRLVDTVIEAGAHIRAYSHCEGAHIGPEAVVGPYARLREGSHLAAKVKIGNFVETKKAHFHEGSKASHLSYIGDAEVGARANIGAGTITCNYDGYKKHRSEIGEGAFIGSDTQLVAPVKVGAGAFVAAGSTVTQDVPADALSLTRPETTQKLDWATKFRARQEGGQAAEEKKSPPAGET
ncbi:MAG: bifunctional UDP-N-acetylglucosamine diphosphorylase/glucosamine-1-phosphate N-acetyltransferase GlmU [Myxococcota bacterium]|nr:bifunctional UDP-N-acetylglucosamine diphosphorylase/glucosamine-1-phosphate N-acetyltransferase GlmU [Myxococcota bacterium]